MQHSKWTGWKSLLDIPDIANISIMVAKYLMKVHDEVKSVEVGKKGQTHEHVMISFNKFELTHFYSIVITNYFFTTLKHFLWQH